MDALSGILAQLDLEGSLYFRTQFSAPWAVDVPHYDNVARFHLAHRGGCFVRIEGVLAPVRLEQGDLVLIMRGAAHRLYCTPEGETGAIAMEQVLLDSGFDGRGALIWGGDLHDQETQLICGHFTFGTHASHPLIELLPSYIHIRGYSAENFGLLDTVLRVIGLEAGKNAPGGDLIALKLAEIIFAQSLRQYLVGEGASSPVMAAFADVGLLRALDAFHAAPQNDWTLQSFAKKANMSRTGFAQRFADAMGMTPMTYITEWRLQLARKRLALSDAPMVEIAEAAGYQSEPAFSRAFSRRFEIPPASYRRAQRAA